MVILAQIDLPPLALHSLTLGGVLLATLGAIFLAYDLLGRENGPLRWFTLVMTCGIVSTLIFVPVITLDSLLFYHDQVILSYIFPLILAGGLMGFYTVILVELPPSDTRPPIFSWRGGLLGLVLALLFWLVGVLAGPEFAVPALALGITCAIITSLWQRLTWQPAQPVVTAPGVRQVAAGEEPSASTPSSSSTGQFEAWKTAHRRPPVFSRKGLLLGLLLGFLIWFVICFTANKDISASLLESVPLALISGVIIGTWRFVNWESPHPRPHLFSRKGFWTGLVAGFVPWLLFKFAGIYLYGDFPNFTGARKGFEMMLNIWIGLSLIVSYVLATAVAGSIAQYTLWRANQLPHRALGVIGVVLLVVAFALQGVQPVVEILNNR